MLITPRPGAVLVGFIISVYNTVLRVRITVPGPSCRVKQGTCRHVSVRHAHTRPVVVTVSTHSEYKEKIEPDLFAHQLGSVAAVPVLKDGAMLKV